MYSWKRFEFNPILAVVLRTVSRLQTDPSIGLMDDM
jgi:hypothetical protein